MKRTRDQNEKTIHELYDAIKKGDFERYFSYLSDEIVYYAAGNCLISGIHKGKEELKKIGAITFKETQGTHRVEFLSMVVTDKYAAVVDKWKASRKGKNIEMLNLLVYQMEGGKITEIREFIEDEKSHDEFWK
jgi:uncharacterized protein